MENIMIACIRCAAAATLLTSPAFGDVHIGVIPENQVVALCDEVEIHLVVSSTDGAPQPFDALDAILTWDPAHLELLSIDDSNAGASFFISDFLPDPDGINDDTTDGEAIYTAFAQPGTTVEAPPLPDELIVTTFVFRAVSVAPTGTTVALIPSQGVFGQTQVLLAGANITGPINHEADVIIAACVGDFDLNGEVNVDDLLQLLTAWGPCLDECCIEDLDGNGLVDVTDLLALLATWGTCP